MRKLFKRIFFVSLILVLLFVSPIVFSAISAKHAPLNSIGIIGGADCPTAIIITSSLIFSNPVF